VRGSKHLAPSALRRGKKGGATDSDWIREKGLQEN
jgi:hypothetical protein